MNEANAGESPPKVSATKSRPEGRKGGHASLDRQGKLFFAATLLVGAVAGLATLWLIPAPASFPPGLGYPPADFPLAFDVVTVSSILRVTLLVALASIYWRAFLLLRAPFQLGLALAFTSLLASVTLGSPFVFDTLRLGFGPGLEY
ncbi:MAG: hypothetical protein KGI89_16870, partial [Euryarchaeota archaeon]|nr:hypothetical protein [Euryarchaeota archaeon]